MDTETGRKATRDALEEAARETGREPAVVQGNFDPRLLTDDSPMSEVNVSTFIFSSIKTLRGCERVEQYCDSRQPRCGSRRIVMFCFCSPLQ